MNHHIKFGTDGWRAVMCDQFILENVRTVADAIAWRVVETGMAERGLVIGYDTRFFSEHFARACAEAAAAWGIPAYLPARPMPTPITAYAIKHLKAAGAIMITASHNPAEYNGIKFIPEYAGPASKEVTDAIEENILDAVSPHGYRPATVEHLDVVQDYMKHLEELVDFDRLRAAGMKVVLDPLYGAAYGIIDTVFASAGCDLVDTVHNHRDPLFGGAMPDPSEARLAEVKRLVLDKGADLGLAVDGDGDRFGAVDYDGTYITANQVIALLARHLLKNRKAEGKLVRTVATTHMLDRIAQAHGRESTETPVGFKYIAAEMLAGPVVIGGEESGGLSIGGHIPEKDGIIADLLMAELVAYEEKPLIEVLRDLEDEHGKFKTERIDLHIDEEAKSRLIDTMKAQVPDTVSGRRVSDVKTVDGVKYLLDTGEWILARASGTEPLVRIYLESDSQEGLEQLKEYAKGLI
ncbi:MAG: phosphoglucomutase/phosphomannomutase family protein [Candidatus Aquicultorales bacterium]